MFVISVPVINILGILLTGEKTWMLFKSSMLAHRVFSVKHIYPRTKKGEPEVWMKTLSFYFPGGSFDFTTVSPRHVHCQT